MFAAKHYLFTIYHHQIAFSDTAISKSLQWTWITLVLTTEKRMHDCIILKPSCVWVCVYNVDWKGNVGGEKRVTVPIRGKFMKVVRFKRSEDFPK